MFKDGSFALQVVGSELVAAAGDLFSVTSPEQVKKRSPCRCLYLKRGSRTLFYQLISVGLQDGENDMEDPFVILYSRHAGDFLKANITNLKPGSLWFWDILLRPEDLDGLLVPQRCIAVMSKPPGSTSQADAVNCRLYGVDAFDMAKPDKSSVPLKFRVDQVFIHVGYITRLESLHAAYIIDLMRLGAGKERINFITPDQQQQVLEEIGMTEDDLIDYFAEKLRKQSIHQQRFLQLVRGRRELQGSPSHDGAAASSDFSRAGSKRRSLAAAAQGGQAKSAKLPDGGSSCVPSTSPILLDFAAGLPDGGSDYAPIINPGLPDFSAGLPDAGCTAFHGIADMHNTFPGLPGITAGLPGITAGLPNDAINCADLLQLYGISCLQDVSPCLLEFFLGLADDDDNSSAVHSSILGMPGSNQPLPSSSPGLDWFPGVESSSSGDSTSSLPHITQAATADQAAAAATYPCLGGATATAAVVTALQPSAAAGAAEVAASVVGPTSAVAKLMLQWALAAASHPPACSAFISPQQQQGAAAEPE
ncbi:hypothetical protein COO60DRAFT_1635056 [Scenedesmus sp. NREL 46B-D3]|nr:hypothetical protein COO60DRAFT_1635056 [Scenedesmus sp. NREL 46B-D3]